MIMRRFPGYCAMLLVAFLIASRGVPTSRAADRAETVPEDICIVELNLPDGAKVTVDGRDYSGKRRLVFDSLQREQFYSSQITVTLRNGAKQQRSVLLRGGWRLPLPSTINEKTTVEVVPQTGESRVYDAVFSPDERYLLTTGLHGMYLWEIATGRQVRRYFGYGGLTFTPDGKRFLAAGHGHAHTSPITATMFETSTGRSLFELSLIYQYYGVPNRPTALSPDGRMIVTVGQTSLDSHVSSLS